MVNHFFVFQLNAHNMVFITSYLLKMVKQTPKYVGGSC